MTAGEATAALRVWLNEAGPVPASADGVAKRLRAAFEAELLNLPQPGEGETKQRWSALAELTAADCSLGRLAEGHADARAILAELAGGGAVDSYGLMGVWAADPPDGCVTAERSGSGWRLHGRKRWCSGASGLDAALVTAHSADGYRLFLVDLGGSGVTPVPDSWSGVGMVGSDTLEVDLDMTVPEAAAIGPPAAYLGRRGFWAGAIGVAACWSGGALGIARALRERVAQRAGEHELAHLGAVDALCAATEAMLDAAAAVVDRPTSAAALRTTALQVRAAVERDCAEILERVGRALGAGPLSHDAAFARAFADLPVYLRQHHAERDLADLGRDALDRGRLL